MAETKPVFLNVLSLTALASVNSAVNSCSVRGHSHIVRDGDRNSLCGKNAEDWPMNIRTPVEAASCLTCQRRYWRLAIQTDETVVEATQ